MEKRNARGKMGREERILPFPSSYRPPRACYFSIVAIFHWDTVREALQRREDIYEHSRLRTKKTTNQLNKSTKKSVPKSKKRSSISCQWTELERVHANFHFCLLVIYALSFRKRFKAKSCISTA